ncbi:MAG: hypothetical protein E5W00_11445 [Mesorhizobium sp.]|nr:MAG: hypothetical protein E5W00_11445 [Mesorhizobium sp.]
MVDEAEIDQLLQIVGDVRAEIIAARAQFAGGQLRIAAGRELIIVFASRLSPGDFLFFTLIATLSNTHKIRLKR